MRNNNHLDSIIEGLVLSDADYCIHRYKTYTDNGQSRLFQLIMWLEVKTQGARLNDSQYDTLYILNQVLRNRRATPTKQLRWQAGTAPLKVYSPWCKKEVNVRVYGVHVLRLSGEAPDNSETIQWDTRTVGIDTLEQLLRFELDPDTLQPIDLRSHHRALRESQLKLIP